MKTKTAPAHSFDKKALGRAASALIRRNPVLTIGMLIGPVVAAAVNLKAAVALSIAVFIMVVPAVIAARLLQKLVPDWVDAIISVLLSAGLSFLAYALISPISPLIFDTIGIYLPVLIVAPVSILGPGRDRFAAKSKLWSIAEVFFIGIGFTIIACLVGLIRELLANASVWGVALGSSPALPAASTVFAGFILLGFLAAMFRALAMLEKQLRLRSQRKKAEKQARKLAAAAENAENAENA